MRLGANKDRKIYGNCQVLSPDGILMFRCDNKKANWYIDRNLGIIVNNNPLTIKLNFKPKGLGNHGKKFGLSEMHNICVNCGTTEYLTKHHIVPTCYRKFFPEHIKSHNFHDVVSMCLQCHDKYEKEADKLKNKLSLIYDAPINIPNPNRDLLKHSKIAYVLLNNKDNIPGKRVSSIKRELRNFFNIKRLTNKILKNISNIRYDYIKKSHGEIVISKIDNLQNFIEMWRSHFLENNDCKYLPDNWH